MTGRQYKHSNHEINIVRFALGGLVVLLLCGLFGCHEAGSLSTGDPLGGDTQAEVSVEEARFIADEFADRMVLSGQASAWGTAQLDPPTLFTDIEGTPVGWEFPLVTEEGEAGAITVGATEGRGVVHSWRTEGPAASDALLALLDGAAGFSVPADSVWFLDGGLGSPGATWEAPEGLEIRDVPGTLTLVEDDRTVLYATLDHVVDGHSWADRFAAKPLVVSNLEEERTLRDAYLESDDGLLADAFSGLPTSVPDFLEERVDVENGAASFASYFQEYRTWSNGTCYAGCSPVAAAALLQFLDRHDLGNLIAGPSDNDNWQVDDGDVRWTIDQLRQHMGTTCAGSAGSTRPYRIDDGLPRYRSDEIDELLPTWKAERLSSE